MIRFIPNRRIKEASVYLSDQNEANFPVQNLPLEYEKELYEQLYNRLQYEKV